MQQSGWKSDTDTDCDHSFVNYDNWDYMYDNKCWIYGLANNVLQRIECTVTVMLGYRKNGV